MRTFLFTTTATLTALASAAAAQDISYANAGLSYSQFEEQGVTLDVITGSASVGVDYGAADLFVDGDIVRLGIEGEDIDLSALSLGAGYTFGAIRADVSYSTLGVDVLGLDENTSFTEVGLAYGAGAFSVRGAYAFLDEDELGAEALYGVMVGYEILPGTDASLSIHGIEGDNVDFDEKLYIASVNHDGEALDAALDIIRIDELSAYNLAAAYGFGAGYGVTGSYGRASFDGEELASTYSLGGYYDIDDSFSVFAELSRLEALGEEVDGFTVGMTYDMGEKPTSRQTQTDRLTGSLELIGMGL